MLFFISAESVSRDYGLKTRKVVSRRLDVFPNGSKAATGSDCIVHTAPNSSARLVAPSTG